jgi:hypothetical protein
MSEEQLTPEQEKELAEAEAALRRMAVVDSLKPENLGKMPGALTEEPADVKEQVIQNMVAKLRQSIIRDRKSQA